MAAGQGRSARWGALAVVAVATAAGLVAAGPLVGAGAHPAGADPAGAAATATAATATAATADQAAGAARVSGRRVEVTGLRSQTAEVYANPSGTFTAVEHVLPVRVRRADGSWAAVDDTLRRGADGTVSPVASPLRLRLSGGGAVPLVSLASGSRSLTLGWPGTLPAPTLAGATATYPAVLPGVDLRVEVSAEGFAETLVVADRAAATNPALAAIRFTTAVSGLRLVAGAGGSVAAVDGGGATAFGLGTPTMWDARGQQASMPVALAPGSLTINPDRAMLTSPATVFPVSIDPSVTVGSTWTMIDQRHPDQSYWSYDRGEGAKVGYVEDAADGWERYRSLFAFSTASFAHKHVLNAVFSAVVTHSYSCSASRTDLYLINEEISAGTTWNNNTGNWTQYVSNVSNQSCDDARLYTEWGGLTGIVQTGANSWPSVTLGLRANDESNHNGWKRFDSAYLSVTYNSAPNAPTDPVVGGKPCATGAGRPYVGSTTPPVTTRVSDPDAGNALVAGIHWAPVGGQVNDTDQVSRPGLANPTTVAVTLPAGKLADGGSYYVQARAGDGVDLSAWSGQCEFTVDATRPDKPPTVDSADGRYPADGAFHGGVGRTGRFTLGANGVSDHGLDDVTGYLYGLADPPTTRADAGGLGAAATVAVAPFATGQTTLYVRSVDRAGNLSDVTHYTFYTASATGPAARWALDEGTGTALADTSGHGNPATLTGGASWTAGRTPRPTDRAVTLDGATGHASTAGPVIDTSSDYTISAWVRLTGTGTPATVVSQNGTAAGAAALRYSTADGKWAFTVAPADSADQTPVTVESTGPALVGGWTQLAGVYDTAAGQARLYVNGQPQGSAAVAGTFTATGPVEIGRGLTGDVDDVRIWDRIVYPGELLRVIDEPELAGEWLLDEGTGSVAGDTSGNDHPLTVSTGATWAPGHNGAGALNFDGVNGRSSTTAAVLDTTQSFSLSAWVRVTDLGDHRTAVALDGTAGTGVYLQYNKNLNAWAFVINSADSATPPAQYIARASAPVQVGAWTHLAAVYDKAAGQLRLYVNGQLQATAADTAAPWRATRMVRVGAATTATGWKNPFAGDIDDVRAYGGVLSDQEIVDLSQQ